MTGVAPDHPRPPRLGEDLSPVRPDLLEDDLRWAEAAVGGDFTDQSAEDVEVRASHLTGVRLTGSELTRARFAETVFEDCDLAGALLYDAVLDRVEFRGCRLSGVVLAGATLRDVTFSGCKLDDANLRLATGERVTFDDTVLRAVDLYGATLTAARFFDCDLTGAHFDQASLSGARFHGSTLQDIVGAQHLVGVVVDSSQVVPLALPLFAGLGITVDDER